MRATRNAVPIVKLTIDAFKKVVQICHDFAQMRQVDFRYRQLYGLAFCVVRKSKRIGAGIDSIEFLNLRPDRPKSVLIRRQKMAVEEKYNAFAF